VARHPGLAPRRGDVFDAQLDPVEGTEQGRIRPVIVVSRDVLNVQVARVIGVPCTRYRRGFVIYPSRVLIQAPDGGLSVDSVALAEQMRVLSFTRLLRHRGKLSDEAMQELDRALAITLDLPY
jgi:mRNA interferase MazF